MYSASRNGKRKSGSRSLVSDTSDTLNNITVGEDDSTIGKDMTSNVLRLQFGAQSSDIGEQVGKIGILVATSIFDLIRHAVQEPRHFILLFTLGLSKIGRIAKSASEAIILYGSAHRAKLHFRALTHRLSRGSMNVWLERLFRDEGRDKHFLCGGGRSRFICSISKTVIGTTRRSSRTGGTITRSSRKTIIPAGARNTRGEETRTARTRTNVLRDGQLNSSCRQHWVKARLTGPIGPPKPARPGRRPGMNGPIP